MPLQLIEDAKGDPRNAQALAVACDLAYFSEAEGTPAFQEQLGLKFESTKGPVEATVIDHVEKPSGN